MIMNDVMTAVDLGCTLFLKLAAGVALLGLAKAFFSMSKDPEPQTTAYVTTTTATGGGEAEPSTSVKAFLAGPEMEEAAPAPAPEDMIECGACGKEI